MPKIQIDELTGKVNSTPVSIGKNNKPIENRVMLVDKREPIDIVEKLRQKGIPVKLDFMSSGDYVFSNIGIERKTLKDFWGSITSKDKRIWRQMFELKRCFERPILIIEQFNFVFLRSPAYSNQVWGTIASIILLGIQVVTIASTAPGSKEFVDCLYWLYSSSDKTKKTYKPLPKKSKLPKEVFRDSLCMIPGIGPGTAKKIVGRYRSFEELCEVPKGDLASICGKTRLKALWRILHGENL